MNRVGVQQRVVHVVGQLAAAASGADVTLVSPNEGKLVREPAMIA